MKNLIRIPFLTLAIAFLMTSCGKEYYFEKVVVNNTDEDIVVQYDCCGNEKIYTIPAQSEETVFVCIYQSRNKPDCSSVEGDFTLSLSDAHSANKEIADANNWEYTEDGINLTCTFTLNNEDLK